MIGIDTWGASREEKDDKSYDSRNSDSVKQKRSGNYEMTLALFLLNLCYFVENETLLKSVHCLLYALFSELGIPNTWKLIERLQLWTRTHVMSDIFLCWVEAGGGDHTCTWIFIITNDKELHATKSNLPRFFTQLIIIIPRELNSKLNVVFIRYTLFINDRKNDFFWNKQRDIRKCNWHSQKIIKPGLKMTKAIWTDVTKITLFESDGRECA